MMKRFRFKSEMEMGSNMHVMVKLHELSHIKGDGDVAGPIFHRGWAKFIEFDPAKGEPELKFFENLAYNEQLKKPHDEEAADDFGPVEIPD